jgi:predicted DNA-binding transcriptional regulator AlpA
MVEDRVVKMPEAEKISGLSRTTIWNREKAKNWPRRIMLGTRNYGYLYSELMAHLTQKA